MKRKKMNNETPLIAWPYKLAVILSIIALVVVTGLVSFFLAERHDSPQKKTEQKYTQSEYLSYLVVTASQKNGYLPITNSSGEIVAHIIVQGSPVYNEIVGAMQK